MPVRPASHPILAAVAALVLLPSAAGAVTPSSKDYSAKLSSCATGATASARSAGYLASMRALHDGERLAVRLDLSRRAAGDTTYATVTAAGLGQWVTSSPGYDALRYSKQVKALDAGADYRATFSFRWTDAKNKVVAKATKTTAVCSQPDDRPALSFGAVDFAKVSDLTQLRYIVPVVNDGPGDAGPFDVTLAVDGVIQPAVTVTGLGKGQTQKLEFVAARCKPGSSVVVALDPAQAIEQADRTDDRKTVACPVLT